MAEAKKADSSKNNKTEAQESVAQQPQVQAAPQQPQQVYNQPQYVVVQAGPVGDQADTKSRLAMMLLAYFALPTGLASAYIGEASGRVRFWVWLGATVTTIIPFLNILSMLLLLVLSVWGLVDFFRLKGMYNDAFGNPMSSTARDERSIGYINIAMIISLVLMALGIILWLALIAFFGSFMHNFSSDYYNYGRYGF